MTNALRSLSSSERSVPLLQAEVSVFLSTVSSSSGVSSWEWESVEITLYLPSLPPNLQLGESEDG